MIKMKIFKLGVLITLLLLVLALLIFLSPNKATSENNELNFLEITWEQLSTYEKSESINDSWKNGTIEEVIIKKGDRFYLEKEYYNRSVYLVTFESEKCGIVGDIEKLIDMETGEIIGYSYRD